MIPSLLIFEWWKTRINEDFIDLKNKDFSPKRLIEYYYEAIENILYSEKLKNWTISKAYVENKMQYFNSAYWTVKRLFQNIERNNWYRYFNHIIWVLDLILERSKTPTLSKILITLNHDCLEDTDISFQTLKELYWEKVAFWVLLISKTPFYNYIEDKEDLEEIAFINESWILNDKFLLSDQFLRYKKYNKSKLTEYQLHNEWLYRDLEKVYKLKRNEDYFTHMLNFPTFYENALKLKKKYKLKLSDDEIRDVCIDSLEVKYFDRIDNLRDSEIYKIDTPDFRKKAYRKIEETKKYFFNISKETHHYIHKMLVTETKKLEDHLFSLEIEDVYLKVDSILE